MLHTTTSLGAHPGSQAFLDQRTILDKASPCCFQVIRTGKFTDLVLSKTKGWEEEGKRGEKKKKIVHIKLFSLWVVF